MNVFFDTNIFHGNWHLSAANFRLLARYLNNEGHSLLLSRLVVEEVQNLHRRQLDTAYQQLEKARKDISRLSRIEMPEVLARASLSTYNLASLVSDHIDNVVLIEYAAVPQSLVAPRAMSLRRPFRESDKGYRDTLIWLSLLEHLKSRDHDRDVAFITQNINDFMAADGKAFHEDLIGDMRAYCLSCDIIPFTSLSSFVDTQVGKDEHALDHGRAPSEFAQFLENEAIEFIESGDDEFRRQLGRLLVQGSDALSRASPIGASITEGLEDFSLRATNDLGNDEVFVSCDFDLRMVDLVFDVPIHDYHAHRDAIVASPYVYEAAPGGPVATVRALIRPAFAVSFAYKRSLGDCSGFSVDKWTLVRRGRWAGAELQSERAWPARKD